MTGDLALILRRVTGHAGLPAVRTAGGPRHIWRNLPAPADEMTRVAKTTWRTGIWIMAGLGAARLQSRIRPDAGPLATGAGPRVTPQAEK